MSNIQFDQKVYKKLTERELQVARFAHEGKTCKDTAEILGIAVSTVGATRSSLMHKVGGKNITQTIVSLIKAGIL